MQCGCWGSSSAAETYKLYALFYRINTSFSDFKQLYITLSIFAYANLFFEVLWKQISHVLIVNLNKAELYLHSFAHDF